MGSQKDGGRAFPCPYHPDSRAGHDTSGMSLLDYFAAESILVARDIGGLPHGIDGYAEIAERSYHLAYAMLVARSKLLARVPAIKDGMSTESVGMTDRETAEADGFTVDSCIYPWVAYKGERFNPTEIKRIRTDLECQTNAKPHGVR